jgi:hypothetical protein
MNKLSKIGTLWLQEIVWLLVNECDLNKAKTIDERGPFIEYSNQMFAETNEITDSTQRVITTHLGLSTLNENSLNQAKVRIEYKITDWVSKNLNNNFLNLKDYISGQKS